MQQVLHKAQQRGKSVKVILAQEIDSQQELSGKVSDISDTGFVITDQKTKENRGLRYEDLRLVKTKGNV
jgi:ribosome maturation factor RimP